MAKQGGKGIARGARHRKRFSCIALLATAAAAAAAAVGAEQPMLRDIALEPDPKQLQATVQALVGFGTRSGGLGGATMRHTLKLRSLEVAGQLYQDVSAEIDAQPSASDVNLGVNVLRHFFMTADFANHALCQGDRAYFRGLDFRSCK